MKRLKFSKEKCIGCELCAQVCSATHEGEYNPTKARLDIHSYYEKGGVLKYHDSYCTLCGICVKNCPTDAIKMDEKITVDNDACVGCEVCVEKCPKNVIKMRDAKPIICDTCDGDPMCVQVCPQGALSYE